MENKSFDYKMTIKEHHLDTFGHVNNATYLQIFEEARWELITNNGYGIDKVKSTGLGPVITDINIKFLKELRVRENIVITTVLKEYTGKIGILRQIITNSTNILCCEMEMKFGLFDTNQRRLVNPTDEWLKAIGG